MANACRNASSIISHGYHAAQNSTKDENHYDKVGGFADCCNLQRREDRKEVDKEKSGLCQGGDSILE